jgi:hypothetical protein
MTRASKHGCKWLVLAGVAAMLLAQATSGFAQDATGGVPGDWLSRYLGARTAGLGGAFVASASDPTGVAWNPAGLSLMRQNAVQFERAQLFESTAINGFGIALPARSLPSIGFTVINMRSSDFEKTNDLNESLGSFGESDVAFLFSASKRFANRFSFGTTVKVVRQSLDEFSAAGVGFDLGAMYDLTSNLRLGASVLNLGGPTVAMREIDETFPVELRGGFALAFFDGRGLLSMDVNHREGPGTVFHGGTEFWVVRSMALRVGYADTSPAGGFSYRITPDMRLDYAATDHDLGVTHRFAVSYRFGGFFASSQASPSVFSPIGQQSVTRFELKSRTRDEAASWRLEILDKSNVVVRRFSGKGTPPSHVMWDGKGETGLPLPDGIYRYQFVVIDVEGQQFVAHERKVEITTEGPQGAVPVFTSSNED